MPTAVCLGETMAMLTPEPGVGLGHAPSLHVGIGGAESNVALGFASMGLDVHWVSRVGRDGFGDRILAELAAHGVGLSGVEIDSTRPTGLYVKLPKTATGSASVLYYRGGSAASVMSPVLLDEPQVAPLLATADLLHLTGITAALSEHALALLEAVLSRPRNGCKVSFDVNWRPTLWKGRDRSVLRTLANQADIVLVGKDEAEHVLGTGDEAEIRALLPSPETVVVKNEAIGATALGRDGERWEVTSLTVDVVEPVGAGDAFAAGYLSGVVLGLDQRASVRQGHVAAASTLIVPGDHGPLPASPVLDKILSCSDETWAAISVSREGFTIDGDAADAGIRLP